MSKPGGVPSAVMVETITSNEKPTQEQQREQEQQEQHHAVVPAPFDPSTVQLQGLEDPRNWSPHRKWSMVAIISLMGFISPLGSSVVVPGSLFIDIEYHLRSRILSLLPVSFFVLGLGMGPFVLAPTSELKGRQPVYLVSSLIFILFNISTALVDNFPALCFLRFMAGAAGSAGPSLGAGSIGDMFAPNERGKAQSLYGLGPLLGPVCGTIAGGWIAQELRSWRWLLWILTILSGAIAIIVAIFLRETFGPVLLRKKRERLVKEHLRNAEILAAHAVVDANVVEAHRDELALNANVPPAALLAPAPPLSVASLRRAVQLITPSEEMRTKLKLAFSRPFRLLFTNPICAIFSVYMGYIYGTIFLFLTQHPLLFQRRESPDSPSPIILPTYNWGYGIAGLTYLGLGLGFITAATINVLLQDTIYARLVLADGRLGWFLFTCDREEVRPKMLKSLEAAASSKSAKLEKEKNQAAAEAQTRDLEKGGDEAGPSSSAAVAVTASSTSSPVDSPQPAPVLITSKPPLKGRPEYRLPLCLLGMIILPCGLFVFGWAAESRAHFMLPLVGSFLVGVGSILPFQSILVYLVDAFIPYSASATACAVLVRSILAAVFPLFSQQLFVQCGYGWGSSIIAFIALLAVPVPIVLYAKGERLRNRFKFNG